MARESPPGGFAVEIVSWHVVPRHSRVANARRDLSDLWVTYTLRLALFGWGRLGDANSVLLAIFDFFIMEVVVSCFALE